MLRAQIARGDQYCFYVGSFLRDIDDPDDVESNHSCSRCYKCAIAIVLVLALL